MISSGRYLDTTLSMSKLKKFEEKYQITIVAIVIIILVSTSVFLNDFFEISKRRELDPVFCIGFPVGYHLNQCIGYPYHYVSSRPAFLDPLFHESWEEIKSQFAQCNVKLISVSHDWSFSAELHDGTRLSTRLPKTENLTSLIEETNIKCEHELIYYTE